MFEFAMKKMREATGQTDVVKSNVLNKDDAEVQKALATIKSKLRDEMAVRKSDASSVKEMFNNYQKKIAESEIMERIMDNDSDTFQAIVDALRDVDHFMSVGEYSQAVDSLNGYIIILDSIGSDWDISQFDEDDALTDLQRALFRVGKSSVRKSKVKKSKIAKTRSYVWNNVHYGDIYALLDDAIDEDVIDADIDEVAGEIHIGNLTYSASQVLKECDPVAYDSWKGDLVDAWGSDAEYEAERASDGDVIYVGRISIIIDGDDDDEDMEKSKTEKSKVKKGQFDGVISGLNEIIFKLSAVESTLEMIEHYPSEPVNLEMLAQARRDAHTAIRAMASAKTCLEDN